MATVAGAAQTVETPAEFGTDAAAKAKRWISEIQLSEKAQEKWVNRCKSINKRYKEERGDADSPAPKRKFAVLWANIQVKRPAIYARPPVPVVSRKFKDNDPVGRVASEVIERALISSIEGYDFNWTIGQNRDEYLLFSRAQAWARYVPHFKTVEPDAANDDDEEDGAEQEGQVATNQAAYTKVDYEEAVCDFVAWNDFGTNVARNWNDVYMVWRRVFMTRDELHKRFDDVIPGGKASVNKIPLDWLPENASKDADAKEQFGKAQIYEVWDKASRKVFWISKGYGHSPLDERDDPLGLKDFFPCPRPMLGTVGRDSMIPTPEFMYYQDQAEEVDELTVRIGILTEALRMVGFYNAVAKEHLANVFAPKAENKLVPVEGWSQFQQGGGAKGLIEWVPIDMVIECLKACFETRKQVLDDIFQITGISDIMRGDTDPDETKGAQQLKSEWGSSRVREDQKEVARFARDILRIMAEIIGNKFSVDTLKSMTDMLLFTDAEKAQVKQEIAAQQAMAQQQAAMAAQQASPTPPGAMPPGAQPSIAAAPPQPPQAAPAAPAAPAAQVPANIQKQLDEPSWDEVMALLRDGAIRSFRIDVETDSTVEPDQTRDRKQAMEYLSTIGDLMSKAFPFIQVAPALMPWVGESIKFMGRRFNVGRELEDILDKAVDAVSQMPPQQQQKTGPDPAIEQGKLAIAEMKEQTARLKAAADHMVAMGNLEVSKAKVQAENVRSQADVQAARVEAAGDAANAHEDRMQDHQHQNADRHADIVKSTAQLIHDAIQKGEDRELTERIADKTADVAEKAKEDA